MEGHLPGDGLGGDKVTFDEQNAQGDSNTCSTIINGFVSNSVERMCMSKQWQTSEAMLRRRRSSNAISLFL